MRDLPAAIRESDPQPVADGGAGLPIGAGAAPADPAAMARLFERARAAQARWAGLAPRARARYLLRMADVLVASADALARSISAATGKTPVDALATEVLPCTLACRWYAAQGPRLLRARRVPPPTWLLRNKWSTIERRPLGVVGIVSPWNYPVAIPFVETAAALLAGNGVLLKGASATPLTGRAIAGIAAEAGLPEGLLQVVEGPGERVAADFFAHGIDKLFFTGSVAAGRSLVERSAATLTPLVLELGGNDAMVVLDDADLERAANGGVWAGYQNAGQSCGAVERIYVHSRVRERLLDLLAERTRALTHGSDGERAGDIGAMTTPAQLATVERQVAEAVAAGARVLARSRPLGERGGLYYPATLVVDTTPGMELIAQETFGPVLAVMSFEGDDEAVALANSTPYALTASLWSRDARRARRLARRLEAGVVTINDHLYTHGIPSLPWGGWKGSGFGRSHGAEGLLEMTQVQVVDRELLPLPRNLWWYPGDAATYEALLALQGLIHPSSAGAWVRDLARALPVMARKMLTRWQPPR